VAQSRPRKQLMAATKSNACQYSMVFWDEMLAKVGEEFPDVKASKCHVDALAAQFVLRPEALDVVVASNLFGDILTDLGGALQGGLGIPASANLNPEKRYPSMFEPVHGSAPDIAGRGLANPIAAIWAGASMLEFLGEKSAADAVLSAMEAVTAEGKVVTPDLGGRASTDEMAAEIAAKLRANA
ncbi:MAG TPA: isocitrate/isopropylmalate family dehydrogenase, partial [Chloroflexota bacterium]|nr:isocitrate/isopropylmalate family dehydrogenase [Chloroflexota bacterium]